MELWIRSQDKERLCQVNGIYWDFQQQRHHITGFNNNDYYWLGVYKTKARALEVLDEIQDLLMGKVHEHHINKFDIYNGDEKKVYQMPKEENI